ncbi:MAG TPA: hypothetical protein VHR66_14265 [Gemmataceae bacterium]|jgi:hypothetical protein|nr:hypothetical protein [Gemmataceae bacterium]
MRHCLVAIAIFASATWADDGPVTIKVKQAAVGDVVQESKTEKSVNKIEISVNGMEQKKDESASVSVSYTEEILAKPTGAKKATKIKRVYKSAEMIKDDTKEDLGLAGKAVLIEKTGDTYKITADGQELTGTAATILGKEFRKEKQSSDADFLPSGPVKVGATWKIDVSKIAKDASADLDVNVDKSSGTGKLVKVYDKDGRKFGVLEIKMELALNKIGPADQSIELKDGAKLDLTLELDLCIDGSSSAATQKMTVKGVFSGSAGGADLKFDLTVNSEGSAMEVKK